MSQFTETELVQDADLTAQESRMPDAARKIRGDNGATPYDGKRELTKRDIATHLRKRNLHPDGLTNPLQLTRAAVFYELHLIYSDMASRNDTVSWDKAKRYLELFQNEMDSLELDYDASLVPSPPPSATILTSIPIWRS